MNAKKLAIELTNDFYKGRTGKVMLDSATMLRQQQAEIEALKTENQELSALCVEFNVLRKAQEK